VIASMLVVLGEDREWNHRLMSRKAERACRSPAPGRPPGALGSAGAVGNTGDEAQGGLAR
jgi:hypothetical protein